MDFIQKFMGGGAPPAQKSSPPAADDDFADFAGAPDPSPAPGAPPPVASSFATTTTTAVASRPTFSDGRPRPFTKWYRVWERVYLDDFYAELFIIPLLLILVVVHVWGSRKNRRKARSWLAAHGPVLEQEFATVGFSARGTPSVDYANLDGPIPSQVLREKSACEFLTYASGRLNVAFVDIKVGLKKRYNPAVNFIEEAFGFFVESMPARTDHMDATTYVFDGKEEDLAPLLSEADGSEKKEKYKSGYDGFVWAIVHKEVMKTLRDERYDLSLTTTKDHPKLPIWCTVMSESAEITDVLLTDQLIKAVKDAGQELRSLIITDQSTDQPKKLNDTIPKKRIHLVTRLPDSTAVKAYDAILPLFQYFLRLPDILATGAHFRPDALRRVRQTREEEIRKIQKGDETEKAEERRLRIEREKKKERDDKVRAMGPEEQKKFLEKERATEQRRSQKSMRVKG